MSGVNEKINELHLRLVQLSLRKAITKERELEIKEELRAARKKGEEEHINTFYKMNDAQLAGLSD